MNTNLTYTHLAFRFSVPTIAAAIGLTLALPCQGDEPGQPQIKLIQISDRAQISVAQPVLEQPKRSSRRRQRRRITPPAAVPHPSGQHTQVITDQAPKQIKISDQASEQIESDSSRRHRRETAAESRPLPFDRVDPNTPLPAPSGWPATAEPSAQQLPGQRNVADQPPDTGWVPSPTASTREPVSVEEDQATDQPSAADRDSSAETQPTDETISSEPNLFPAGSGDSPAPTAVDARRLVPRINTLREATPLISPFERLRPREAYPTEDPVGDAAPKPPAAVEDEPQPQAVTAADDAEPEPEAASDEAAPAPDSYDLRSASRTNRLFNLLGIKLKAAPVQNVGRGSEFSGLTAAEAEGPISQGYQSTQDVPSDLEPWPQKRPDELELSTDVAARRGAPFPSANRDHGAALPRESADNRLATRDPQPTLLQFPGKLLEVSDRETNESENPSSQLGAPGGNSAELGSSGVPQQQYVISDNPGGDAEKPEAVSGSRAYQLDDTPADAELERSQSQFAEIATPREITPPVNVPDLVIPPQIAPLEPRMLTNISEAEQLQPREVSTELPPEVTRTAPSTLSSLAQLEPHAGELGLGQVNPLRAGEPKHPPVASSANTDQALQVAGAPSSAANQQVNNQIQPNTLNAEDARPQVASAELEKQPKQTDSPLAVPVNEPKLLPIDSPAVAGRANTARVITDAVNRPQRAHHLPSNRTAPSAVHRSAESWSASQAAAGQTGASEDPHAPRATTAAKPSATEDTPPKSELRLAVRTSFPLRTGQRISRVSVANRAVCDAIRFSEFEVALIAKKSGQTEVAIWFDGQQRPKTYRVHVGGSDPERANVAAEYRKLQGLLDELFPQSIVTIHPQGEKLIVHGEAKDKDEAIQILRVIRGMRLVPIVDQLRVRR